MLIISLDEYLIFEGFAELVSDLDPEYKNLTTGEIFEKLTATHESTLGNNFLKVSGQKSISKSSLKRLHDTVRTIIKKAIDNKNEFPNLPDKIVEIRNLYNSILKRNSLDNAKSNTESTLLKSNDTVLKEFANHTWYCYERNPECLARKVIKFGDLISGQINNVIIEMPHSKDDESDKMIPWQGTAHLDQSGQYVIVIAYMNDTKKSKGYTHLMISVNPGIRPISFCCGHITFDHPENNHILTKTVLLEKLDSRVLSKPSLFSFDEQILSDEITDENIKRFLNNKRQNRLSSPKEKTITSKGRFNSWMKANIDNQNPLPIKLRDHLIGSYILCFHPSPIEREKISNDDEFIISTSKDGAELKIDYYHKVNGNTRQHWSGFGILDEKKETLSFFSDTAIYEYTEKESTDKEKLPIYIILSAPTTDTPSCEVLTGIIAGTRDKTQGIPRGIVSRLFIAVKNNTVVNLGNEEIENKTIQFFNAFLGRSWVRPSVDEVFFDFGEKFEAAIKEGIESKVKLKRKLDKRLS